MAECERIMGKENGCICEMSLVNVSWTMLTQHFATADPIWPNVCKYGWRIFELKVFKAVKNDFAKSKVANSAATQNTITEKVFICQSKWKNLNSSQFKAHTNVSFFFILFNKCGKLIVFQQFV